MNPATGSSSTTPTQGIIYPGGQSKYQGRYAPMTNEQIGMSCDIGWFAEQDIDIWLAEELRVNGPFANWFLAKVGKTADISVPAYRTRVSILDGGGRETDVEALFRLSDEGIRSSD
jgi:hypothetical protein